MLRQAQYLRRNIVILFLYANIVYVVFSIYFNVTPSVVDGPPSTTLGVTSFDYFDDEETSTIPAYHFYCPSTGGAVFFGLGYA